MTPSTPSTRPVPPRRRFRRILGSLLAVTALILATTACQSEDFDSSTIIRGAHHVSPNGSDSAAGTETAPWRTMQHALSSLRPGDTLYVHGGTYTENVNITASRMNPGTKSAPVHVKALPGERPVVKGLLWLTGPSYWHLEGINVTWNPANSASDHMVKLRGGTGWRFSDAEVWNARSYAAVLVGSGAKDFRVDRNFVHDTHAANDVNQDHLIYVDNGHDGNGVIERNVLARSANGRGVKLGPGSTSAPGTNNIVVRYNTFYSNRGPSNVQFSGSSSGNQVYGNLMDTSGSRVTNVTAYKLTGTRNVVRDNLGWNSTGVAQSVAGIVDGGGNVHRDPKLADPARDEFRPLSSSATRYGIGGS